MLRLYPRLTQMAMMATTAMLAGFLSACAPAPEKMSGPIRIMLDRAPTTLNPRMSSDLTGQRIGELIYGALTKKDKDMKAHPELSESWTVSRDGKEMKFKMRPDARDHSGAAITAERMASCLEEYLEGKPHSTQAFSASSISKASARGDTVVLSLSKPDPYLPTNLSTLRYFTTGDPDHPCREPKPGQTVITSGEYRPSHFAFADLTPELSIDLVPMHPESQSPLRFTWNLDDNAKAIRLLRGETDVLATSLSLSKTRWLERTYPERFRLIDPGKSVSVSYLQFNFKSPILSKREVRRAIALSIDREDFVKNKLYGFGTVANSILSPILEESAPQSFPYDPALAEKLLDQAGYPRRPDGTRFSIRYKTTPVRDGFETAQTLQAMLRRVGIELVLEVVEPAVFIASTKKGSYDMYSSRWIGVSDASIFDAVLRTKGGLNRGSYSNPEIDALLDRAMSEPKLSKRKPLVAEIQRKIAEDLPFVPLWYWDPDALMRRELRGVEGSDLSASGSLEPLTHLRY